MMQGLVAWGITEPTLMEWSGVRFLYLILTTLIREAHLTGGLARRKEYGRLNEGGVAGKLRLGRLIRSYEAGEDYLTTGSKDFSMVAGRGNYLWRGRWVFSATAGEGDRALLGL